jgi:hypothetical protein
MKAGIVVYILSSNQILTLKRENLFQSSKASFFCCVMQDSCLLLIQWIHIYFILLGILVVKHQLDYFCLIIHCSNMQRVIAFIRCFINIGLFYPFFVSLLQNIFQNLNITFLADIMKYSPPITVLLIDICTTLKQYPDGFYVLLFVKSFDRLQQSKCTKNCFLFIYFFATRN